MTLDRWDDTAKVTYDRAIWDELCSLRFVDGRPQRRDHGPVGVGKTFLATALGHTAVRRRHSVHFERADHLFKRLRATRLDNSHDTEIRKLLRVDLLIIDDFALQPSTRPTPPTSTKPSSNATARLHNRHLEPRTCRVARPTWPTRSSPSPPSTGSNPPPTNSSSTASPTDTPEAQHHHQQPRTKTPNPQSRAPWRRERRRQPLWRQGRGMSGWRCPKAGTVVKSSFNRSPRECARARRPRPRARTQRRAGHVTTRADCPVWRASASSDAGRCAQRNTSTAW